MSGTREKTVSLSRPLKGIARDGVGDGGRSPSPGETLADAPLVAPAASPQENLLPALRSLEEAVVDLQKQFRQLVGELRRGAVELALDVAARIGVDLVDNGAFAIESQIRACLVRLEDGAPSQAHLSPADLELLEKRLGEQGKRSEVEFPGLRFVADSALARGEVRLRAGEIAVWADVRRHLAQLRAAVQQCLTEDGTDAPCPAKPA